MNLDGGGPARAASIRERNERLVLRLIFRKGPLSQSEAAKLTGLKPPTVFRIFLELERAGLIAADAGRRPGPAERKGRRPQDYRVVPSAAYAVGVDFWAGSAAAVVLAAVDEGATTADEVARSTGLAAGVVAGVLVELELGGLVEMSAGVVRR
jgi:predicted Rossmann fold nucleotide-binding protein DprA/Smf involved in DNA uptake